jgi:hypothetical protein
MMPTGTNPAGPGALRLGIALSGGGFRATLFHLGVIRFLYDAGLLNRVTDICSVSGVSILAAHLGLNWGRYTGTKEDFERAAGEIINFVRQDVRGRIVRRWILSFLAIFPPLLKRGGVDPHRAGGEALLGVVWEEAPRRVAGAFAARSVVENYPYDEYLADGGVFDNLGIRMLQWLPTADPSHDFIVVSDAQGCFDLAVERRFSFVVQRTVRATDILMQRVSDLELRDAERAFTDKRSNVIHCDIHSVVPYTDDGTALDEGVQQQIRMIRTDLDQFSREEIYLLVRQGYTVARNSCKPWKAVIERERPAPGLWIDIPWNPLPAEVTQKRVAKGEWDIPKSNILKKRLWSARDWASWASLALVLLYATIISLPYLWERSKREEYQTKSEQIEGMLNETKREVADIVRRRERIRPVQPGTSVGHFKAGAGTLCCIVRDKDGQKYILSAAHIFAPEGAQEGDPILQPGPIDGADKNRDQVAKLSRWISPKEGVPAAGGEGGAIARVLPTNQVSSEILGIGPIRGIQSTLQIGETVQMIGRTSPIIQGQVASLTISTKIWIRSMEREFTNLILIQAPSGPFSQAGDSGAPVLTMDGRLIGMVYAGWPKGTLVIPIRRILDALEVELDQ